MANKRKQHLKYQAKKGRLQSDVVTADESKSGQAVSNSSQAVQTEEESISVVKNTAKSTKKPTEISKLPEGEVAFVRRELIYLVFVAMILLVFYLVIWLVFKYTGIDEYLYSLIKLKS